MSKLNAAETIDEFMDWWDRFGAGKDLPVRRAAVKDQLNIAVRQATEEERERICGILAAAAERFPDDPRLQAVLNGCIEEVMEAK